jgi:hypothetical protein
VEAVVLVKQAIQTAVVMVAMGCRHQLQVLQQLVVVVALVVTVMVEV